MKIDPCWPTRKKRIDDCEEEDIRSLGYLPRCNHDLPNSLISSHMVHCWSARCAGGNKVRAYLSLSFSLTTGSVLSSVLARRCELVGCKLNQQNRLDNFFSEAKSRALSRKMTTASLDDNRPLPRLVRGRGSSSSGSDQSIAVSKDDPCEGHCHVVSNTFLARWRNW